MSLSPANDNGLVESWRPCSAGYEVSDLGRVRNVKTGRVLKPWRHWRSGHLYVSFGGRTPRHGQIHRLVLLAFLGPPPSPAHECLHGDGDPTNNTIGNLRWGTRRENLLDMLRHRGRIGAARFTYEEARAIRAELRGARWGAKVAVARRHGVSVDTIYEIANGKTYSMREGT